MKQWHRKIVQPREWKSAAKAKLWQVVKYACRKGSQMTLTPNDQSAGVAKFVLRVETTTLLPTNVEIHETDGKLTTLRLNNAHYTDETPSFTIEKEGVFINDLR